MKKISSIIIALTAVATLALLPSCKKEVMPSHLAKVSFPVMTLNGPQYSTVNRGTAWTDPGVTWTDTVTGESGTITKTVNTSNDSAYLLVYTATNKNGFQSTITRGLGVTNYSGPIDISGNYTDSYGGTDSLYLVSRAMFFHPNVDLTYTADYPGDAGLIVIKSDSTISVATVFSGSTGTVGATIPTTFSDATISYTTPITFGYTVTILNVPPYPVSFTHN